MESRLAGERIAAAAEEAGEPAVRRPDRRRGAASASRRSTSWRTKLSRLSSPCSRSRSTPNVSSGEVSELESTLDSMLAAIGAAGRALTHHGRQLLHRARRRGIERRARAEIVDDAFERLDLRR